MPDTRYDIVVVGGGHNNLAAAAYLAKAGLSVIVLEKNATAGGGAVSRQVTLPGFIHDLHATGVVHLQGHPMLANDELELKSKFGLKFVHPQATFMTVFDDGDTLATYGDLDLTCADIARFSQKDAESYRRLVKFMEGVAPMVGMSMARPPVSFGSFVSFLEKVPVGQELLMATLKSCYDLITEYFEHVKVRIHFLKWAAEGLTCSPEDKGTGIVMLFLIGGSHTFPAGVVVGGTQSLTDAMVRCILHHGGEMRVNALVKRVITSGGEAKGVELADGTIQARKAVIASIHPHLLATMVGGLDAGLLQRAARTQLNTFNGITVHGALDEAPNWKAGAVANNCLYVNLVDYRGMEHFRRTFDELRYGHFPPVPSAVVSVHTNYDQTRAPPGKHTLYCFSWGPMFFADMPFSRWGDIKDSYAEAVWQQMARFATNLSGANILARSAESPLDMQRHTPSFQRGDSSGLGNHLYQTLGMRPTPELAEYRVPGAKGLFLGGPFMHPGPGLTGGGRPLAIRVMEDLGLDYSTIIRS